MANSSSIQFVNLTGFEIQTTDRHTHRKRASLIERKSLRHIAMAEKFLDGNKLKIHFKSKFTLFQTSSIFISLLHFTSSFSFNLSKLMLAKLSGLNPKGPYLRTFFSQGQSKLLELFGVHIKRV